MINFGILLGEKDDYGKMNIFITSRGFELFQLRGSCHNTVLALSSGSLR